MKYYIAADGGGTKLQVILYDEDLHIISSAKMSGTNTILRNTEDVLEEMRGLIRELIPESITEIESADLCILKYEEEFLKLLRERCVVRSTMHWDEGMTPLLSSGVCYGIVAQAGTGSDAFLMQPWGKKLFGGWGFILGDEGSGYDIGRQGLRACVLYGEGRGPATIIYDILFEEWNLDKENYWGLIEKVYNCKEYKNLIASVARVVAKAAKEQDPVAIKIYEDAGHAMASQVLGVITWNQGVWEGPIITSGGAWKGCPKMFETFREDILEKYPEAVIQYPIFEPVAGCAIGRQFEDGKFFEEFEDRIREEFTEFLYQ